MWSTHLDLQYQQNQNQTQNQNQSQYNPQNQGQLGQSVYGNQNQVREHFVVVRLWYLYTCLYSVLHWSPLFSIFTSDVLSVWIISVAVLPISSTIIFLSALCTTYTWHSSPLLHPANSRFYYHLLLISVVLCMLSLQAPPQYGQAPPQYGQAQPQAQPQVQTQPQNQGQGQGQNQGAYGSSSNNNNGNNSNQGAYGGEDACLTWRVLCLLLPYTVCRIPYAADSQLFLPYAFLSPRHTITESSCPHFFLLWSFTLLLNISNWCTHLSCHRAYMHR